MPDGSSVRYETDGRIGRVVLDRQDSMNSLDLELAVRLRRVLESVVASDVEALVLTGAGRGFCAGGDIKAMAASGDAEAYLVELTREVHESIALLREMPVAVIARVNGPVAGGGLGLVLAADISIASSGASFTAAYGSVGLSPDCGVSALLPAAVGASRARAFLLGGKRIDALAAQSWGVVSDVVEPSALDDAVSDTVDRVLRAGRASVAATKALLSPDGADFRRHLEREAGRIAHLAGSTAATRIAAFAASSRTL